MAKNKEKMEELLSVLAAQSRFTTAKELARDLQVSEKTIYRLVKSANQTTAERDLIKSEKGRGFKLNADRYLNGFPHKNLEKPHDPAGRQGQILERLLLMSPRSLLIYDLAREYFVAESVIAKDRLEIQKRLKAYRLKLVSRKRALSVIGQEIDIRRAIADLVSTFSSLDIDHLELLRDTESGIDNGLAAFVQTELSKIEAETEARIPYPYNINIFSHLYIMIDRVRKPHYQIPEKAVDRPRSESDQDQLLAISRQVIRDIENYVGRPVQPVEVSYLYQYLVSSRFQGKARQYQSFCFSSQVISLTQFYFEHMPDTSARVIASDSSLFADLANHIAPLLKRLENQIHIKNKMLAQIKVSYPDIFDQALRVSELASQCYGLPEISSDEVGFLTIYFARFREIGKRPIRTLIMCTSGIGTSELLRSKVANLFPDLQIVAVLSYSDLQALDQQEQEVDLLITTVDLEVGERIEKVLVSAILTEDDRQRLSRKIEEIHYAH